MKKTAVIFLALGLGLIFCVYAIAEDLEVGSQINAVTVYPGSALIVRTSTVKLNPGAHKVIFSNIIPEIDENSLRASGSGTAEVKILGVQLKKEFLQEEPAERTKQLQGQIQDLRDETRKLQDIKKIFSEEKKFLDSIRLFSGEQLPKDLVTKMPTVKDLEDMLKFLDAKLKDNYFQIIDVELKIRDIEKKINVLLNELAQVSGSGKKLKRSVVVELEVLKAGNLDLNIAYLVSGASWQPIYDARANFNKAEVELISQGLVKQATGEDWANVEISLSTSKPSIGGRMPYVSPWFIRPYQPVPSPRPGRWAMTKAGASESMQTEAFYSQESATTVATEVEFKDEARVEYAQFEAKGLAVVYKLTHKATIKSDGSEYKLPISSQTLKVDFEYSTYPRVNTYAYLGSRVMNSKDLQLLGGRVNVFLDGDFVGASSIDTIGPGEDFDLYLGVDESVKVKREQIAKKVDDVLIAGIPAPTRKTTFKYKLTVENYKNKKIKAILFEAMPVSQDERIKVNVANASLVPEEKDWKDRKGVWRWELDLEPQAKQEIFYSYSVEHPRDMQVDGLSSTGMLTHYDSQVAAF